MKGHTKIELFDEETGQVEVHEDNNMVTNALNLFLALGGIGMQSNGLDNSAVYSSPIWQTYLGGLMLFENRLDEDPNNVLPPAGVKMVGNGAYDVFNNDMVTELGSYNSEESGLQEDGSLKLVWDFATSQANGTIHCACLSSKAGGYIGAGNAASQKNAAAALGNVITNGIPISTNIGRNDKTALDKSNQALENYCMLYGDYNENELVYVAPRSFYYVANSKPEEHWYNSGVLKILKYRFGMSSIDLFEQQELSKLLETANINVPEEIRNHVGTQYTRNYVSKAVNGKNVYFLFHNTNPIAVNSDFYILKVNEHMESTTYKMKNTTDNPLYIGFGYFAVTSDEYAVITSNVAPNDFYKIKLADNTDVKKIENIAESYPYGRMKIIYNDRAYDDWQYVIDLKAEKMYPINSGNSTVTATPNTGKCNVVNNPLLVLTNINNLVQVYRRCDYLATINNLEEPVVKTASKSMKVTYTLSFD